MKPSKLNRTYSVFEYFSLEEKYIVNKQMELIAVQLDIKTFKKIEDTLENFALAQYMNDTESDEVVTLKEAKVYYKKLIPKYS